MESKENQDKKPLTLSRPGRLELKKTVETGQVRQSFSHGRSKAVTVEVKRRRTFAPGAGGHMTEVVDEQPTLRQAVAEAAAAEAMAEASDAASKLTVQERAARARAVVHAKQHQAEAHEAVEAAAENAAALEVEAEAFAPEVVEPSGVPAGPPPSVEAVPTTEPPTVPTAEAKEATPALSEEEEEEHKRRRGRVELRKPATTRRVEPRRRTGKLTISQALDDSEQERTRSLAAVRRARLRERQRAQQAGGVLPPGRVVREVVVPETMTVQELANRMAERGADVIKALMKMGVMATINQAVDADTAELLVAEFGHRAKRVSEADVEIGLGEAVDSAGEMVARPPVVTVMGHVDHGKTSLLDALRATDVAAHEAGGITQHIGAYRVRLPSGKAITFIDTPGHEAFSSMRARGANVTDIVVLVVAADDGVMAQTVEAIRHAQAAKVPIIVAVNKIDKPDANPQRVRQELLSHNIVPEEFGGDVLCIDVSAKEKTNLDKLEETILLQAELLELMANPHRPAEGTVIEARLERGLGPVATVLVQRGTLRPGDIVIAGGEWGRVRGLIDDRSNRIDAAGPAEPVEVLGITGMPEAGDRFIVVENEARAREIAAYRQRLQRDTQVAGIRRGTVEQMLAKISEGSASEIAVVIKADVQGSVEAVRASLEKLRTSEVAIRVLHSAVGGITESDVTLAAASKALILGFNVRANPQARDLARRDGIDIRYYSIIYDVVDEMKALLSGMLAPTQRETQIGTVEIRQVFNISKVGRVAGCMVTQGAVRRGARVRLLRDNVVVHEGKLGSLRRFKDEVREVKEGYECGLVLEDYNDIQFGDVVECYEIEEVARAL